MLEKIEGIVLETIKHSDKHNVVTLYTRQRGRMAFLVPAGNTKAGRLRSSVLSLMNVVKAEVNVRAGKELLGMRRPEPSRMWHGIYSNPLKSSLLFFLAEFCGRLVRQYPPDDRLWDYLIGSLEVLDNLPAGRVANFHIAFLVGLLPLAGIMPPARRREAGDMFDMLSGEMVGADSRPLFTRRTQLIPEVESKIVPQLMRINFRNMGAFRFRREERRRVLDRILQYYAVHLPMGTEYRSLGVLRELFD